MFAPSSARPGVDAADMLGLPSRLAFNVMLTAAAARADTPPLLYYIMVYRAIHFDAGEAAAFRLGLAADLPADIGR